MTVPEAEAIVGQRNRKGWEGAASILAKAERIARRGGSRGHSAMGGQRGYCRICGGPHVYKHGRP